MQDVIKKEKNLSKKLLKIGQFFVFLPALIALIFHNHFSSSELSAILIFYSLFILLLLFSFLQSRSLKRQKIITREKGPSHTLISSLVLFVVFPSAFTVGILSLFFSPKASFEESSLILFFYLLYNLTRFYLFLNLRNLKDKKYFFLDLAWVVFILLSMLTEGQQEKFEVMLSMVFLTSCLHYIIMPPPDAYSKKAARKIHNPCFVLNLYYKFFSKFFNKKQRKIAAVIINGINTQKEDVAIIKDNINAQKRFLKIITKPHGSVNIAKKLAAVVNEQSAQNKHALIEKELGRPLPLSSKQCYALKDKFNIDIDSPLKRVKRETLIQALEYILAYKINDDHFKKLRKGIDQQGKKTYNVLSLCQIISNESTAFDENI